MSVARVLEEDYRALARHPNELDLRRIQRAIGNRKRYRYVEPVVLPDEHGYQIKSACCSRNVDPDGGVVDVALLRWFDSPPGWWLYRKNHEAGTWVQDSSFTRLTELFDRLNTDPDRIFWQ